MISKEECSLCLQDSWALSQVQDLCLYLLPSLSSSRKQFTPVSLEHHRYITQNCENQGLQVGSHPWLEALPLSIFEWKATSSLVQHCTRRVWWYSEWWVILYVMGIKHLERLYSITASPEPQTNEYPHAQFLLISLPALSLSLCASINSQPSSSFLLISFSPSLHFTRSTLLSDF